jgi:hypothetical protein
MIVAPSSFRNMPKMKGKCATGRIALTVAAPLEQGPQGHCRQNLDATE